MVVRKAHTSKNDPNPPFPQSPPQRIWRIPAALKYILCHEPWLLKGKRVALHIRVSSKEQGRKKRYLGQIAYLKKAVCDAGGSVVLVVKHEWSGYGHEYEEKLRAEFDKVASVSADVLLFATLDRLARHPSFRSYSKLLRKAVVEESTLIKIHDLVDGRFQLMCYNSPEATPEENQSLLIRWGNGGRPKKKQKGDKKKSAEEQFVEVRSYDRSLFTLQEIAHLTRVKLCTVFNWWNRGDDTPYGVSPLPTVGDAAEVDSVISLTDDSFPVSSSPVSTQQPPYIDSGLAYPSRSSGISYENKGNSVNTKRSSGRKVKTRKALASFKNSASTVYPCAVSGNAIIFGFPYEIRGIQRLDEKDADQSL